MKPQVPHSQTPVPAPDTSMPHCPDCGYSLLGLPETGNCPECGVPYDTNHIVVYGWAADARGNMRNVSTRRLVEMMVAISVGAIYFGLMAFSMVGSTALILAAALIACVGFALFRRRQVLSETQAPYQLRMCKDGYAVRTGFGPVTLLKWGKNTRMAIVPLDAKRFRVWLIHSDNPQVQAAFQLDIDGDAAAAERFRQRVVAWSAPAAPTLGA